MIKLPKLIGQIEFEGQWLDRSETELTAIAYTVGRSDRCDICVDFVEKWIKERLSKFQFTLYRRDASRKDKYGRYLQPGYDVADGLPNQPTRNGTFLNGDRLLVKTGLKHGDLIAVVTGLRFFYSDAAASPTTDLEETLTDGEKNENP